MKWVPIEDVSDIALSDMARSVILKATKMRS